MRHGYDALSVPNDRREEYNRKMVRFTDSADATDMIVFYRSFFPPDTLKKATSTNKMAPEPSRSGIFQVFAVFPTEEKNFLLEDGVRRPGRGLRMKDTRSRIMD